MKINGAFWDTSAIVPICCRLPSSIQLRRVARKTGRIVVWWGTTVEARSAFAQMFRRQLFSDRDLAHALSRVEDLRKSWREVAPSDPVRELAEQLPEKHAIRASDAFQLAAALVWCKELPKDRVFVCADKRLAAAAEEAGFTVLL